MSDDIIRDLLVSFSLFAYGLILVLLLGMLDPLYELILYRIF